MEHLGITQPLQPFGRQAGALAVYAGAINHNRCERAGETLGRLFQDVIGHQIDRTWQMTGFECRCR